MGAGYLGAYVPEFEWVPAVRVTGLMRHLNLSATRIAALLVEVIRTSRTTARGNWRTKQSKTHTHTHTEQMLKLKQQ